MKCARSVPAYFAETLYYAMKVKSNFFFFSAAIFGLKLIECVKLPRCRVQELMTTPWSEWWSAAVRWTCWTSELHSEGCLPVLFIPWSRYKNNIQHRKYRQSQVNTFLFINVYFEIHIWTKATVGHWVVMATFISIFQPVLQGDTGGDYRKALLLLCGGDDA